METKLKRIAAPVNYTGLEPTYYEVVHVKDGIATCKGQAAVKALLNRGYKRIESVAAPVPEKPPATKPAANTADAAGQKPEAPTPAADLASPAAPKAPALAPKPSQAPKAKARTRAKPKAKAKAPSRRKKKPAAAGKKRRRSK